MIQREDRGPIAVLRLAHGKASALDTELLEALDRCLRELDEARPEAVVLTGTGSIFSAGVDLLRVLDGGTGYLAGFLPLLARAVRRLFAFPRPVVAAVNGHAIAGGCILACACDLRIMAAGEGRIGVPELRVGVPFPVAQLEVLRFAVPPQHLQKLAYTGRTYGAAEALEWGLVDEVVAPDRLLERALEAAGQLAAIPGASFELTKAQLRRPTLERIDALHDELEPRVAAQWASPGVQEHLRDYVDRTLRKQG